VMMKTIMQVAILMVEPAVTITTITGILFVKSVPAWSFQPLQQLTTIA